MNTLKMGHKHAPFITTSHKKKVPTLALRLDSTDLYIRSSLIHYRMYAI